MNHLRYSLLWLTVVTMSPKKELSTFQRIAIVALRNAGFSYQKIANQVNCSKNGVVYNLKRYKETNSERSRHRSGRPEKLSEADVRKLKITALKNRKLVLREHMELLNSCLKCSVSRNTVR